MREITSLNALDATIAFCIATPHLALKQANQATAAAMAASKQQSNCRRSRAESRRHEGASARPREEFVQYVIAIDGWDWGIRGWRVNSSIK